MNTRRGCGGREHQFSVSAVPAERENQLFFRRLMNLVDPRAERLLFNFFF
jgi:hypothetical protein